MNSNLGIFMDTIKEKIEMFFTFMSLGSQTIVMAIFVSFISMLILLIIACKEEMRVTKLLGFCMIYIILSTIVSYLYMIAYYIFTC